jgi:hypothetical protein
MTVLKSALAKGALVAVAGAFLVTSAASADVACNGFGDCWHVRQHFDYPAGVGVVIHPDAWATTHRDYHWRHDRFDRGYYDRGGVWIAF